MIKRKLMQIANEGHLIDLTIVIHFERCHKSIVKTQRACNLKKELYMIMQYIFKFKPSLVQIYRDENSMYEVLIKVSVDKWTM